MWSLAGDGLLHWSNQVALLAFDCEADKENIITALRIFAEKSGPYGMLGGQSVDVLKTCALIEASLMIGAALAGVRGQELKRFERIGYCVGMAFQIKDDILDHVSTTEELGKPVGSDEKNEKTTYVTLFGIDEAQKEVERLSKEAVKELSETEAFDIEERAFLLWLINSLTERKK